jgi:hypothetical protein
MIPLRWCDSRRERNMMRRLNHGQEQFFYSFRLDDAVPEDHPVRRIAGVLESELGLFRTGALIPQDWPAVGRSGADDPNARCRLRVWHPLGTCLTAPSRTGLRPPQTPG